MPDIFVRNTLMDIDRTIHHTIADKQKGKFVIYTNGIGGKLVKEYLESEFNIKPEYVIDNKAYNGEDILNIKQAKKRDNRDTYFLICSWHKDFYDAIREAIYEAFPKEQIIDVFPCAERKELPTNKEICDVLHLIDMYTKNEEDRLVCNKYTTI